MGRLATLFGSSVGKKTIVAVTGLVMVGFLLGHASGNLKVFLPDPEPGVADIDVYAEFLRTVGEPLIPRGALLWTARFGLLFALVLHVVCIVQLSGRNRAARSSSGARPGGYRERRYLRATLAARLMLWSGVLLFAFLVFHLLHLTLGTIDPAAFERGKVYANLYHAFSRWPLALLYVAAVGGVALHLYHGVWSVFQTLGLDAPERNTPLRLAATLLALVVFLGFVAVPISFASGVLAPPAVETAADEPGSASGGAP